MPNQNSFATRLRQVREDQRMSKSALARRLGISTTGVWNWEEGNTMPRPENMRALSNALNTPVEYLQNGTDGGEAPVDQIATPTPNTLAEVIADAKKRIAHLAGVDPANVHVSIDY